MTFVRDLGRDHAAHPSCHSYSVPIARAIESVHFPHGAASVISIALQFPSPERAQLAHRRVNEVVFTQCRKKKKKKRLPEGSRVGTARRGTATTSVHFDSVGGSTDSFPRSSQVAFRFALLSVLRTRLPSRDQGSGEYDRLLIT